MLIISENWTLIESLGKIYLHNKTKSCSCWVLKASKSCRITIRGVLITTLEYQDERWEKVVFFVVVRVAGFCFSISSSESSSTMSSSKNDSVLVNFWIVFCTICLREGHSLELSMATKGEAFDLRVLSKRLKNVEWSMKTKTIIFQHTSNNNQEKILPGKLTPNATKAVGMLFCSLWALCFTKCVISLNSCLWVSEMISCANIFTSIKVYNVIYAIYLII